MDNYLITTSVPGQSVAPLISKDTQQSARRGDGMIWIVPVNNAGKGTDAVRLHFDVIPREKAGRLAPGTTVPFDLVVPIQTGDEI